jgi:hypothetical protein
MRLAGTVTTESCEVTTSMWLGCVQKCDDGTCWGNLQVEDFWVVMPCSVVVVYQRFRGPCSCYHNTARRHNTEELNLNLHRRENLNILGNVHM